MERLSNKQRYIRVAVFSLFAGYFLGVEPLTGMIDAVMGTRFLLGLTAGFCAWLAYERLI
jgi:hypothetical protein